MQLIQVRESQTHGMGVFATALIPRRTLIGVYEGRRYHAGEETRSNDDGITYLFALSDGATIDGAEGGNETRFINHSCRPNCEAIEADGESDELELEIQIRARRGIRPGEELFLDYALVVADGTVADYACRCGEATCRGTMAALVETA